MIQTVCALLLVGLAGLSDLYCNRVPNRLVLGFLGVGVVNSLVCGLPEYYQLSFLFDFFMIFLWRMDLLGAADVKVCFILSLLLSASIWIAGMMICLLISLVWLLLHREKKTMPMMPAFFVGLVVVLLC